MNKDFMKAFLTATGLLPERLWRAVFTLNEDERLRCEEIRLRASRPLAVRLDGKTRIIRGGADAVIVSREEILELLAKATGESVHTYGSQIAQGFITAENGHRIGICGEMAVEDGVCRAMREYSSVSLRIAKQALGIGDRLAQALCEGGFESTLILAPPGAGKTTLLRDLARRLSYDFNVSVADERREIAACRLGVPGFELGRCDILSGCAKAEGIEMLVRAMSPDIIALDEITSAADVRALSAASFAGCRFLTTAHGAALEDLSRRAVYRELMELGVFKNIMLIENNAGARRYRLWRESNGQDDWADYDCRLVLGGGNFCERQTFEQGAGASRVYCGLSDN